MVVPEDGMDKALARARQLFTAVDIASRQAGLDPGEERALSDIREQISLLESQVRSARLEADEARKAELINAVDPLRRRVIAKCHDHQKTVRKHHALVQEILDWCELKEVPAPHTPMYRGSVEDVPSTDAMISTPMSTTPDISSGWVQSHARGPYSKMFESSSLSSLTQSDWETKQALRALKTGSSAAGNNSNLTVKTSGSRSPTKIRSPTRRRALQQQQLLAAGQRSSVVDQCSKVTDQVLSAAQSPTIVAVAMAGNPTGSQHAAIQQVLEKINSAREASAKLARQRSSAGGSVAGAGAAGAGSSLELEQQQQLQPEQPQVQQQPSWRRRTGGFLHLDRGDMSLTSSGYSSNSMAEQDDSVLIGVPRRYDNPLAADDDVLTDPVGGSHGWESLQHLRQQHPGMRTSLRTSADILGALRSSHVTEAAILSSNASRVHILHDAVAQKPKSDDDTVQVPVIPAVLARRKKHRWWVKLIKALAGTAGTTVVLALVAVAAKEVLSELDKQSKRSNSSDAAQEDKQRKQQQRTPAKQQQLQVVPLEHSKAAAMPRLRYASVGPAPDASAGCG